MSATADDFAAAYYNPAGTAFQTRPVAGVGYMLTDSAISGIGVSAPGLDYTQGLLFGTTLPLPFGGFLENRLSFGISTFFPNGLLLGIKVPYPTDPQYVVLQNSGRSLTLIPTLGVKLTEGIAVGGGAQLFDNTSGELNATIDPNGTIQATVGQELTTSFAATFGILLKPGEYWDSLKGFRLGFVFRDRFFTTYDIPVNTYIANVPLNVSFRATSLYTPRQWIAGVAYSTTHWLWEADLSFNEWSHFPDPNLVISTQMKIPILPVTLKDSISYPPHFHDTFTVRAGTEWMFVDAHDVDFLTRLGYSFDPSPVPSQHGDTNYLDTDRHITGFSMGCRWHGVGDYRFDVPFLFDLGVQGQYLVPRTSYKRNDVDRENPGYPKVGLSGWLYAICITVSTEFDYE